MADPNEFITMIHDLAGEARATRHAVATVWAERGWRPKEAEPAPAVTKAAPAPPAPPAPTAPAIP